MSSHDEKVRSSFALAHVPALLGAAATSGLLLGCLAGGHHRAKPGLAAAAGDPVVVGTTTDTDQKGAPRIRVPIGTQEGDLLLLFLHRTDAANLWSRSELKTAMTPWHHKWAGPVATCAIDNATGDSNCRPASRAQGRS